MRKGLQPVTCSVLLLRGTRSHPGNVRSCLEHDLVPIPPRSGPGTQSRQHHRVNEESQRQGRHCRTGIGIAAFRDLTSEGGLCD